MNKFECEILKDVGSPCEWALQCLHNRTNEQSSKNLTNKMNNDLQQLITSGKSLQQAMEYMIWEHGRNYASDFLEVLMIWMMIWCARNKVKKAGGL